MPHQIRVCEHCGSEEKGNIWRHIRRNHPTIRIPSRQFTGRRVQCGNCGKEIHHNSKKRHQDLVHNGAAITFTPVHKSLGGSSTDSQATTHQDELSKDSDAEEVDDTCLSGEEAVMTTSEDDQSIVHQGAVNKDSVVKEVDDVCPNMEASITAEPEDAATDFQLRTRAIPIDPQLLSDALKQNQSQK